MSAFSKTSTAVIGNLFGCMIASVLPDVFIGMFGDKLINYEYDRSKGVLWNNKKSFTAGEDEHAAYLMGWLVDRVCDAYHKFKKEEEK